MIHFGNHYYTGIKKKLCRISNTTDCAIIAEWSKSITNYLYWCAASAPNGNGHDIVKHWKSLINHICQEIEQILDCDSPLNCVTMQLDFPNACLSRIVLTIAFHGYGHHYGSSILRYKLANCSNNFGWRFQYLAYRQLVRWGWNH